MLPLVTIGIPCYNSAGSLHRAIESALWQTGVDVEVIVVDDGSTDTSLVVAGAFGDRITLRRASHQGANAARNLILEEAQGTWLQYLDADDYLEPEKITRQLEEGAGGDNADVLYSPVWMETVRGDATLRTLTPLDHARDLYSQWLLWHLPQTGGALWRRDALLELKGWKWDQPCCQEHELYLRAILAGLRFQYTPTPGAVYRIWSEETLCRKDPRAVVMQRTKLIDNLRQWMHERGYWTPEHQRLAGQVCFEMARTLARQNLREARQYYRERKRQKLIRLHGPAAPASYCLVRRLLGFTGAERLASLLR